MFILSQRAHPVQSSVEIWLETNSQQLFVLHILHELVTSVLDRNIPFFMLHLIHLAVLAECRIVHLLPNLVDLLDIFVPLHLVLLVILKHMLLSIFEV
jgi:hypothetical protein